MRVDGRTVVLERDGNEPDHATVYVDGEQIGSVLKVGGWDGVWVAQAHTEGDVPPKLLLDGPSGRPIMRPSARRAAKALAQCMYCR